MSNNNNNIIPNLKKYWLGVKREFKYIIQCAKLDKWYAYSPNMFLLSCGISARKEKGENHTREKKFFDLCGDFYPQLVRCQSNISFTGLNSGYSWY